MSLFLLVLGLILFVGLVVVHEFGHFLLARRNGVEVEEFGIGFPPRAWSRKTKDGYLLSLNWLPLGGFVKLKGEHDAATARGTFGAASTWAKTKIMLAGVTFNLITAFVLLTFLALVGMPQLIDNQFTIKSDAHIVKNEVLVGYVEPGSPAARAGLQAHDRLLSYAELKAPNTNAASASIPISRAEQLPHITKAHAGRAVAITYERHRQQHTVPVRLLTAREVDGSKATSHPKVYLGVSPVDYRLTRSTWSAPLVAAGLIKQFTVATFQGLGAAIGALFQGKPAQASAQVSGPVGIFVLLKDGSLLGYQFVLLIIAVISLTLAIMNVLPIPALDGGRLFLLLTSRAMGMPLNKEIEERIVATSFAFLLLLIMLITIVDVKRFF